jgi:hypothetical protein
MNSSRYFGLDAQCAQLHASTKSATLGDSDSQKMWLQAVMHAVPLLMTPQQRLHRILDCESDILPAERGATLSILNDIPKKTQKTVAESRSPPDLALSTRKPRVVVKCTC